MKTPFTAPCVLAMVACSGPSQPAAGSDGPSVDSAPALRGVPDHGDDPAVVLLDVGGGRWCSAALLEADVVLTARECVPGAASELRVLVGEDRASAIERARGAEAFVPLPGSAGVALVLLDTTIDDVAPLTVRTTAPAVGDHLRTVGFGVQAKLVRDHVAVVASGDRSFALSEAACAVVPGAPAIDETTGELVGAMTNGGPGCDPIAVQDDEARVDVALPFVTQALLVGRRQTAAHAAKTLKGPIDMGATCQRGADCAAGVCVAYAGARYCSRTCAAEDRCPTKFRCMQSQGAGPMVCVEE
jgi:hypothetical protein